MAADVVPQLIGHGTYLLWLVVPIAIAKCLDRGDLRAARLALLSPRIPCKSSSALASSEAPPSCTRCLIDTNVPKCLTCLQDWSDANFAKPDLSYAWKVEIKRKFVLCNFHGILNKQI